MQFCKNYASSESLLLGLLGVNLHNIGKSSLNVTSLKSTAKGPENQWLEDAEMSFGKPARCSEAFAVSFKVFYLENSRCEVNFHQLETPKTSNPVA